MYNSTQVLNKCLLVNTSEKGIKLHSENRKWYKTAK